MEQKKKKKKTELQVGCPCSIHGFPPATRYMMLTKLYHICASSCGHRWALWANNVNHHQLQFQCKYLLCKWTECIKLYTTGFSMWDLCHSQGSQFRKKNSPLDTKQIYSKIKLYAFYMFYLHHKNSPLTSDLPQPLPRNLHPPSSLLPGSQYGCRLCVGMTALPSFYREYVPLFSHPCSMIP